MIYSDLPAMPEFFDYIDYVWHHAGADESSIEAMRALSDELGWGDLSYSFVCDMLRAFAADHPHARFEAVAGPEHYAVLFRVHEGEVFETFYYNVEYPESVTIPQRKATHATIDAPLSDALRRRLSRSGTTERDSTADGLHRLKAFLGLEASTARSGGALRLPYNAFDTIEELENVFREIVREAPVAAVELCGFWRVSEKLVVVHVDDKAISVEDARWIPGTWAYDDLVLWEQTRASFNSLPAGHEERVESSSPKSLETLQLRLPRRVLEMSDPDDASYSFEDAFIQKWQSSFIRLLKLGPDDAAEFERSIADLDHIDAQLHLAGDNLERVLQQCDRLQCSPSIFVALTFLR